MLHAWHLRQQTVPPEQRSRTAFFARDDGTPFCSDDVKRIGRKYARLAGWSAEEVARVGTKWARIGGGSDWRDHFGPSSRELLRGRGRWGSDMDELYSRVSLVEQLSASAAVADTEAFDIERAFPGYAQRGR